MTQKRKAKDNHLIYIGPNLPRGILLQYAVFCSGVPPHLKAIREQHPDIDELIVPVDALSSAQVMASTPGTSQYEVYQELKNLSGKGA